MLDYRKKWVKKKTPDYSRLGPDCLSFLSIKVTEYLWDTIFSKKQHSGTAYQLRVLDYKAGTSGTDNRFKIASYS